MDVVSLCPLRAGSLLWQSRTGTWVLTVVCKATFVLRANELPLAEAQDGINDDDNHWNNDRSRSLYAPSDLVPFKPRADVLLVGSAFAPRKEPVHSLTARLFVGEVDKSIDVFGERALSRDGQIREGAPFTKMPLRYERAAGGASTSNPVGVRFEVPTSLHGAILLPNLQPSDVAVARPGSITPVGFGPIAPSWPERVAKLGGRAGSWPAPGWTQRPLPDDIDPSYFNAAPPDQQLDVLLERQVIILENLNPEHPRLVTSLPGVRPRATIERPGPSSEAMDLTPDTLWIDTDRGLCTVTWRGQVQLKHRAEIGRVAITADSIGARETSAHRPTPANPSAGDTVQTLVLTGDDVRAMTMPFVAAQPGEDPAARFSSDVLQAPVSSGGTATLPGALDEADEDHDNTAVLSLRGETDAEPISVQEVDAESDERNEALSAEEPGLSTAKVDQRAKLPPALPFLKPSAAAPSAATIPAASPAPRELNKGFEAQAPVVEAVPVTSPAAPQPLTQAALPSPVAAAPPAPAPPPPPARPAEIAPPALVRPAIASSDPLASPLAPPLAKSPWVAGGAVQPSSAPQSIGAASALKHAAAQPIAPGLAPHASAVPSAGARGVQAASDAAAAAMKQPSSTGSTEPAPQAAPAPRARTKPREVVKLLWHDAKALPRVRKHPQWSILLAKLELRLLEAGDDEPEGEAEGGADRRDVFEVLARGEPIGPDGIGRALDGAIDEDGKLEPPLVLIAGELDLPFDELETLKATATAVTPFAQGDKRIKETLDLVTELLQTPWLGGAGGLAETLTGRLKEAFAQGKRVVPPDVIDAHTDRMLLEQRAYQKRAVYGKRWIRALLGAGGSAAVPVYVPESLAGELPMFRHIRVRMLAEVDLREDQNEASPHAVKVMALGRVTQA
jgi:hypothetical protein